MIRLPAHTGIDNLGSGSSARQEALRQADDSLDRALNRLIAAQQELRQTEREVSRAPRLRWTTILICLMLALVTLGLVLIEKGTVGLGVAAAAAGFIAGVATGVLVSAASRAAARGGFWISLKQINDLVGAGSLLVVLAPVLVVIMAALKLESTNLPVLIGEIRIGQHGRPFQLLRFRTSRVPMSNVPSVFGNFLEQTGMAYLPLLVNVIRGEMSLVGPRPRRPAELIRGLTHVPRMRPGMVSLADVERVSSLDDAERLDRHYEEHWSFGLDLRIALRTMLVALSPRQKHDSM